MVLGRSLHIGLNSINSKYYGNSGALAGCENDARAMEQIAKQLGYETEVLLTEKATSAAVMRSLALAAKELKAGDYFLLSYAGHGSQVPDVDSDEDDAKDETWCLWDRMVIDDELYRMWALFKPGVRVTVVSDSCHSGTVIRVMEEIFDRVGVRAFMSLPNSYVPRVLGEEYSHKAYTENQTIYDAIQWGGPRGEAIKIHCSVYLISGCMDHQTSGDGAVNGLFTQNLLAVWNAGGFTGSLRDLRDAVSKRLPPFQIPNYYAVGDVSPDTERYPAFRLPKNKGVVDMPDVNSLSAPRCHMEIEIDQRILLSMSDYEIEQFLRTNGADVLIEAYKKTRAVGTLISQAGIAPRGQAEIKCKAEEDGKVSCEGKVSWTF